MGFFTAESWLTLVKGPNLNVSFLEICKSAGASQLSPMTNFKNEGQVRGKLWTRYAAVPDIGFLEMLAPDQSVTLVA